MKFRSISFASVAAATIVLAACNGGGHTLPPDGNAPAKPATMTKTSLRVFIPAKKASAKRSQFVSPSTQGIVVAAFASPYNTGAVPVASGTFDVSSGSPACAPSSGGSTCTFSLAIPASLGDDFIVTTYDTAPQNGAIPTTAQRLGYGRINNQPITAGYDNTIALALGGIVAKVTLSLPTAATANWSCTSTTVCQILHVGALQTQTVTVNALDAQGNTIVSDGWYDVNGNPVSVTVNADALTNPTGTPAPLGFNTPVPAPSGTATPLPMGTPAPSVTINSPSANSFMMTFDPSKLSYTQMTTGFGPAGANAATVTASASNGISGTAKVGLSQSVYTYAAPVPSASPAVSAGNPYYLKVSPFDKKIWVGENSVGSIASFDPVAKTWSSIAYPANALTGQTQPNTSAGVQGILPLSNGSGIWFIEKGANSATNPSKIAELALPVTTSWPKYMTETALSLASQTSSWATSLAQDAQGNFWVTVDGSTYAAVIKFNPTTGVQTRVPLTYTSGSPLDIAASPDGKTIWTADSSAISGKALLYQINASTATIVSSYQLPGQYGARALTVDSGGTVWVGDAGNHLESFNPSTSTWSAQYPTGGSGRLTGSPNQIIVANDKSVWVTENSGKIAHFVPASGGGYTLIEFQANSKATIVFGVVADPSGDGSIWYAASSDNNLNHLFP